MWFFPRLATVFSFFVEGATSKDEGIPCMSGKNGCDRGGQPSESHAASKGPGTVRPAHLSSSCVAEHMHGGGE